MTATIMKILGMRNCDDNADNDNKEKESNNDDKKKRKTMTMTTMTAKKKRKGQTRCNNKSQSKSTINPDYFLSVEGSNADRDGDDAKDDNKQRRYKKQWQWIG